VSTGSAAEPRPPKSKFKQVSFDSQGLTNTWKAFPSPLTVNEYHIDIVRYGKKNFVIIFLVISTSPNYNNLSVNALRKQIIKF